MGINGYGYRGRILSRVRWKNSSDKDLREKLFFFNLNLFFTFGGGQIAELKYLSGDNDRLDVIPLCLTFP